MDDSHTHSGESHPDGELPGPGPEAPLPPPPRPAGRGLRSTILAGGAAVGMILAGLAVASAQTDSPSTTAAQTEANTTVPDTAGPKEAKVHKGGLRGGARLRVAATTIGITEAELVTALRGGQSIAQVAQSKNVDPQKVIDAMVAEARTKLEAAAAALPTRITDMVNRAGLPEGPGGPGRHKGRGPGGPGVHRHPAEPPAPPTTAPS